MACWGGVRWVMCPRCDGQGETRTWNPCVTVGCWQCAGGGEVPAGRASWADSVVELLFRLFRLDGPYVSFTVPAPSNPPRRLPAPPVEPDRGGVGLRAAPSNVTVQRGMV